MSRLLLVRHGQARAFEEDSDRLSEAGFEQGRRFGAWLMANAARGIDEVRCGTLLRQRQTVDAICETCAWLPAPLVDERWNEFDSAGVIGKVSPVLATAEPAFAQLVA